MEVVQWTCKLYFSLWAIWLHEVGEQGADGGSDFNQIALWEYVLVGFTG